MPDFDTAQRLANHLHDHVLSNVIATPAYFPEGVRAQIKNYYDTATAAASTTRQTTFTGELLNNLDIHLARKTGTIQLTQITYAIIKTAQQARFR